MAISASGTFSTIQQYGPTAVQTGETLANTFSNKKDPERFAANENAYKAAIGGGDHYALDFLKYRSGKFGSGPTSLPGWYSDSVGIGGWATPEARDDAFGKYNLASAAQSHGLTVP